MPDAGALPRATPESVGVSSREIERFLDVVASQGIELHSLMLWRKGRVIAEGWWEPYRRELWHMQHSLTKSFTATGIGLAQAEGLLQLDDRVVSFFPDDLPDDVGANLTAMTVRDLLTMRTGHRVGIAGSAWRPIRTSWVREFFRAPVEEKPGSRFVYNSAASYMLSAIVQARSGQRLHDYLIARLLQPLGIGAIGWDVCPNGINPGGNGLSCRTEDLLRFAALHLQDGVWDGRRVLPQGWVARATAGRAVPPETGELHMDGTPAGRGYGLQWWTGPAEAFYASGMFGQYAIVLPRQDAALAITAAIPPGDQRLLDLVWRDLCPVMSAGASSSDASGPLGDRLTHLALTLPSAGLAIDASAPRRYDMAANDDGVTQISFDFGKDGSDFTLTDARGRHRIRVGADRWCEGETSITGDRLHHAYQPDRMRVAAWGSWRDQHTYAMTWRFIETAFCDTVICRFDDDRVTLDRSVNVNSGPTFRPTLHGIRGPSAS